MTPDPDPLETTLVFSCWRLTLDLLQKILLNRGIHCLRIDGLTSLADRERILSSFCADENQRVLLLSIGTGWVGLTLTVANKVHIVESQWNPFTEEQSIARASRIGQTRPVTVLKYITQNTVEQIS
ncbi:P-loop containing nucleoside triphosphate hydrolase protein [Hypoxylon sp. NC1633]|nr:P-loop containing nucleoside triphosphate hydrolase protein [Hypoxylon sp. NC1633]